MAVDWNAIGYSLGGLLIGAGAMWRRRTADSARIGADAAVANSEGTLYTLLTRRLEEVETDMKGLRAELAEERARGRQLETHIYHLENLMRAAGMDPPVRAQMLG